MSYSRRQFIVGSASALTTIANRSHAASSPSRRGRSLEKGTLFNEIHYGQVKLGACLPAQQLQQVHRVLMTLDEQSLLRPFRLRVGGAAPGCNLGGWYSSEIFAGETFGQWLSALARYHAITGDAPTRQKIHRLVSGFGKTVVPSGQLYGDAKVTGGPAYLFDKMTCGLVDAAEHAHCTEAIQILDRATSAVIPLLPGRAVDYLSEGPSHESYTIPENQFRAWECGGSDRHLELAKQYIYHSFFDALAKGENALGGRHAYSHVNSLCSAAKAYLVYGDQDLLRAAVAGFEFIEEQSYATGGWGPNETFLPVPGATAGSGRNDLPISTLSESLARTHWHFETPCGTYAHFKLARYLLRITGDPKYGDSMERVMLNAALGAKPLSSDGRAFYQSDYGVPGQKRYYDGDGGQLLSEWPCCSGTLGQLAADYGLSAYFRDAEGLVVNLYIPSTVTWSHSNTRIRVLLDTTFPRSELMTLRVDAERPTAFSLKIRIPRWTTTPELAVNGEAVRSPPPEPGQFYSIRRDWKTGDRVEVRLPAQLTLKPIDKNELKRAALMHGPLALFAMTAQAPRLTQQQLLSAERSEAGSLEWDVSSEGGPIRFVPFFEIGDESYVLYHTFA
jgi:DUF1680 family protein